MSLVRCHTRAPLPRIADTMGTALRFVARRRYG
jgi:hypothetical protein